jgi:hypothetical protein
MTADQPSTAATASANAGLTRPSAKTIIGGGVIALLTILTQIVLRRALAPGEFGTVNALFGVTIVLLVPFAAFSAILRRSLAAANDSHLHVPLLNRAAIVWSLVCLVLFFVILPLLRLPRASLEFFMLLTVAGGVLAICGRPATPVKWCAIVGISAAVLRLIVSAWAGAKWPTAESGLGALVLGFLLAGLPALRDQSGGPSLADAWKVLRPTLVPGLATISVALALALFTNADRIAAQGTFGSAKIYIQMNFGRSPDFIDHVLFDDYQAAGMLARWLLWGLLPLLALLYTQRTALRGTTHGSLRWFWIYLGALVAGVVLLILAAPLANLIFTGDPAVFVPGFAGAVFMLGLLQGIAVFALSSRRWIECFLLGALSLVYTGFLFYAGHQPQIMTSCMFGGALISLMLVLLVGVVRYARSHP